MVWLAVAVNGLNEYKVELGFTSKVYTNQQQIALFHDTNYQQQISEIYDKESKTLTANHKPIFQ